MLLNTDLHLADIEQKMTRSQFIKNTMTTIKQAVEDYAPDAFDRRSILPGRGQSLGIDGDGRPSTDYDRHNSFRASFKPPPRSESALGGVSDQLNNNEECGPLVKAPFDGPFRAWEAQVEIVLKDIYASIRDERLPLYGAESVPVPAQGGLSVKNMLKRTPSVLSKAPSETASTRGRIAESAKASASRWSSKSRSRPRAFGGGNGFSSSRTSFDDGNSLWSPTESSATWSRQSLGRTPHDYVDRLLRFLLSSWRLPSIDWLRQRSEPGHYPRGSAQRAVDPERRSLRAPSSWKTIPSN